MVDITKTGMGQGALVSLLTNIKDLVNELRTDHAAVKAWFDEVDSDLDSVNNYNDYLHEEDGVRFGDYTFAETAAITFLGAGVLAWVRAGIKHYFPMDTTITLEIPSTATIADTKFGAWRVVIDDLGAVTTQAANATTMQFASAEIALANLCAIAPTANTTTVGYIVCENAIGGAADFTIGTQNTSLTGVNSTFYYERAPRKQITGLTAVNGAVSAVGSTPEQYSTGTLDYMVNGVAKAQDGAQTTKAFDDADVITTSGNYGGWLIVSNLANASTLAIAANGILGAASTMDYASVAAANTAIDTIADRLPSPLVPISRLTILANKATWTAKTDDLSGTDGTPTFTDSSVGTWDRTTKTGFDSHQINPPAVPATVSAPVVATVSESALSLTNL